MEPAPSSGGSPDPTQGATSVDQVPVVHVTEAPPAEHKTATTPDDKGGKALEWVKAVGMPLVTLVVTIAGGYYLTNLTKDREARETDLAKAREARESDERLYAQLLTQREQSDAVIRKDMFGVVINRFLAEAKKEDWSDKILELELLASNFNQSLDLAPLFKDLSRRLAKAKQQDRARLAELKQRLDVTAANVIIKQVNSLARRGFATEAQIGLAGAFGKPFIAVTVPKRQLVPATPDAPIGKDEQFRFEVEVVDISIDRREVEIRLRAYFGKGAEDLDRHFWVGLYDFPMLDNTQLPYGLRASVVITEFLVPDLTDKPEINSFVNFHFVVFPAAGASFKERQDYDDILNDMLRAKSKPIG